MRTGREEDPAGAVAGTSGRMRFSSEASTGVAGRITVRMPPESPAGLSIGHTVQSSLVGVDRVEQERPGAKTMRTT